MAMAKSSSVMLHASRKPLGHASMADSSILLMIEVILASAS